MAMDWILILAAGITVWFGVVWFAASICVVRDQLSGHQPTAIYAGKEPPIEPMQLVQKPRRPLALWQRIIMVPLAVLVIPPTLFVLIPIIVAWAMLIFSRWFFFRTRFALFGIPIPQPELPAEDGQMFPADQ